MSPVVEIESAIEKLGSRELEELANWWNNYLACKLPRGEDAKLEAIKNTSGCLSGDDGEAFEKTTLTSRTSTDSNL